MKNKRLVIILILLLVVVVGVLQIIGTSNRKGKVLVTISVSPRDSEIAIDGVKVSGTEVYLAPGKYSFTAKREFFTDYSKLIEIRSDDKDAFVILLPGADSKEAKQYLKDRPGEQSFRESLGGIRANIEGAETRSRTPLIDELPFIDLEYRIDYGPSQKNRNDPTAIAITITSTSEASKQEALDWIRFKGYEPSELEIIYKSF